MREASDPGEMIPYPVWDGFPPISIKTVCREVVGNFGKKKCVNYSYPLLGGESHVRDNREVGIYGGADVVANDLIIIFSAEEHT